MLCLRRMRFLKSGQRCIVVLALFCASLPVRAQERCGAGKDLVVQALERAGPQSSPADFEDALQLLKRASAICGEAGDPWYYRSLVEGRLGHAALAKFAGDKARLLGSEAQSQGLQPFVLATLARVASRGLPGGVVASGGAPVEMSGATSAGPLQKKWALVIGISRFSDRNIPQLNYTSGDADSFAALLADPTIGRFAKANIHTLTDAQATTRNIREQLNWIARQAGPNDMVVIYLATHGSPRETDSVGGLNYLITYDTEIHSIDHPDEDALYATALPMVDLTSTVATRVRALRTVVVLDTCFSGGSVKNSSHKMGAGLANAAPAQATLQRMSEGSGRIVMAASRVDQESLESDTLKHGYFTYFLLKNLREGKGMSPLTRVFAATEADVSKRVVLDNPGGDVHQDPVLHLSSEDADFALGLTGVATTSSNEDGYGLTRTLPVWGY